MLPSTVTAQRRSRWVVAGLTAAAVVTALLYRTDRAGPRSAEMPPPARSDTSLRGDEMGGFFLPAPLMAQVSAEPRYQRLAPPGGERLKPGRWFYNSPMLQRQLQPSDTLFGNGIERATWQGQPAWLTLGGRRLPSGRIEWRDSLWLSRDSLLPLFRVGGFGDNGRIEQTWRDGHVLTGETVNGYTSWRSRPIVDPDRNPAEGVSIKWYQFLATLQSGELGPGWRRSLEVPFRVLQNNALSYFLDLQVFGEETVTVPAGTFECWKVGIGEEYQGHLLWVDKQRGWIVAQSSVWGGRERYRQVLGGGEDLP